MCSGFCTGFKNMIGKSYLRIITALTKPQFKYIYNSKNMEYQIKEFSEDYITTAVDLFLKNYKQEQASNLLMPLKIIKNPEPVINALKSHIDNPGIALFQKNTLIAYMVTCGIFHFKGQKCAMISEYGHASEEKDKKELYRLMYMSLSSEWIHNKIHLHIIGHLAHDITLKETLYLSGFGAILSEKVRDFTPIKNTAHVSISYENDPARLIDIQCEHNNYYPLAPIFIKKTNNREEIASDLDEHKKSGDTFFVYYENNNPAGYFIIGKSNQEGEGFLLKNTNTAQIKSAYLKPAFRGRGIGASLLQESIKWAKEKGFERLFVEHETANYYGGKFWSRHFSPYLYYSMRYIDNTI